MGRFCGALRLHHFEITRECFFLESSYKSQFRSYWRMFFFFIFLSLFMKAKNENIKAHIISLIEQRKTFAQIAEKTATSKATISRIAKESNKEVPRRGRPSALTDNDERYYRRSILKGEMNTAVEAAKDYENKTGKKVSPGTFRRAFHRQGLIPCKKQKKPLLRPVWRKARLEWAKSKVVWTVDDWKHVIFSDETKVC